jgi:hypothetical protein
LNSALCIFVPRLLDRRGVFELILLIKIRLKAFLSSNRGTKITKQSWKW